MANTIVIIQPGSSSIVPVTTPGPMGPVGPAINTGSLVNTSSFNTFTSSYQTDSSSFNNKIIVLTNATSSYVTNSQTSSFVTNSQTSSFVTNSQTASFVLNSQTSSFVINSQTSSFVQNSQTSSFVTNSQTSSFVQNSQTSSFVTKSQTGSFATTGSNTFKGSQTIHGNLFMSGSFPLVYNNSTTNNMLFGLFDGSTIYGPYYQLFGNQYPNASQRGGAEFVYDTRNGGDANFHISSYDGSSWTQKFRVDDNGVQVTGSLYIFPNQSTAVYFGVGEGGYLGGNINSLNETGLFSGNSDQTISSLDITNNFYRYANNSYIYNETTQQHIFTGSLSVTGSAMFTGSLSVTGSATLSNFGTEFSIYTENITFRNSTTNDQIAVFSGGDAVFLPIGLDVNGLLRVSASGGDPGTIETNKLYVGSTGTPSNAFFKVSSSYVDVTGSVSISNILTLKPQHPLPSGVPTGSFAVSSSTPPRPYMWDGSSWYAL